MKYEINIDGNTLKTDDKEVALKFIEMMNEKQPPIVITTTPSFRPPFPDGADWFIPSTVRFGGDTLPADETGQMLI